MLPGHRGRGFYAAQTFSHEPHGRVVQIGWLQTATPGMPFNQGMSLPLELGLRSTPDGPRLTWPPVEELKALRARKILNKTGTIGPGDSSRTGAKGELIELSRRIRHRYEERVDAERPGHCDRPRCWQTRDPRGRSGGAGPRIGEKQRLVIYADRTCLEVFASDGLIYVPLPRNFGLGDDSCPDQGVGSADHVRFSRDVRAIVGLGDS